MNGLLIVLLDDNDSMNFLNEKMCELVYSDASIKAFTEGEEALQFLQTNLNSLDFSGILVFLDINMPLMSGWQFLESLELIPDSQKVKVTMLSSSTAEEDKAKSREYSNVVHYIEKPLSMDSLTFLNSLLEN